MENIDQSTLNQLLAGNTTSLIPESFMQTVTIGFIALNIISVIFVIIYLVGTIRKWKVQSAVLSMQKDVSEIKQLLTSKDEQPSVTASDNDTSTT